MDGEATQPERGPEWSGVLRREIAVELRVLNDEDRTIEVIASTEALDSHGDVLKQFWDFKRYDANPVVLWNHNKFESSNWSMGGAVRPEDLLPIGQSVEHGVKSKKLHAKLKLASAEYSELAQKVWLGCKERVIRAVSVGFRPGAITAKTDKAGHITHYELGSEDNPNELVEISFVPMGSNPQAVAKSIAFEREHLGRLLADKNAATRGSTETDMAMTAEEQKALETAKAEALTAKAEAKAATEQVKAAADAQKAATERAEKAEAALTAMQSELKSTRERAAKAEGDVAKTMLDGFEGKKFGKASREHFEKVLAAQGLDATKALLESLPDLAVTQPVLDKDGKAIGDKPAPAPAPTGEGDDSKLEADFSKALSAELAAG
jgi:hypothetical protein